MAYRKDRFEKNVELYEVMKKKLSAYYSEKEMFDSVARYFVTFTRVCFINEVSHIKTNGIGKCIRNIRTICNNINQIVILAKYKYVLMPAKYALVCQLTRRKLAFVLTTIIYLQMRIKGKI